MTCFQFSRSAQTYIACSNRCASTVGFKAVIANNSLTSEFVLIFWPMMMRLTVDRRNGLSGNVESSFCINVPVQHVVGTVTCYIHNIVTT